MQKYHCRGYQEWIPTSGAATFVGRIINQELEEKLSLILKWNLRWNNDCYL